MRLCVLGQVGDVGFKSACCHGARLLLRLPKGDANPIFAHYGVKTGFTVYFFKSLSMDCIGIGRFFCNISHENKWLFNTWCVRMGSDEEQTWFFFFHCVSLLSAVVSLKMRDTCSFLCQLTRTLQSRLKSHRRGSCSPLSPCRSTSTGER